MVLALVMASKRHLKPSIRGVKMMKKQLFFKIFKVLHDFDMKLYNVSRGENVEKQMVLLKKRGPQQQRQPSPAQRDTWKGCTNDAPIVFLKGCFSARKATHTWKGCPKWTCRHPIMKLLFAF